MYIIYYYKGGTVIVDSVLIKEMSLFERSLTERFHCVCEYGPVTLNTRSLTVHSAPPTLLFCGCGCLDGAKVHKTYLV